MLNNQPRLTFRLNSRDLFIIIIIIGIIGRINRETRFAFDPDRVYFFLNFSPLLHLHLQRKDPGKCDL